jgi:hypothetical protein
MDKSTFMNFTLYNTTLDIEHFGLQGLWLWGNDNDAKQATWLYSVNQTFDQLYIENYGRCTPSSVRLPPFFSLRLLLYSS